jgi:hypothetical protein
MSAVNVRGSLIVLPVPLAYYIYQSLLISFPSRGPGVEVASFHNLPALSFCILLLMLVYLIFLLK